MDVPGEHGEITLISQEGKVYRPTPNRLYFKCLWCFKSAIYSWLCSV